MSMSTFRKWAFAHTIPDIPKMLGQDNTTAISQRLSSFNINATCQNGGQRGNKGTRKVVSKHF